MNFNLSLFNSISVRILNTDNWLCESSVLGTYPRGTVERVTPARHLAAISISPCAPRGAKPNRIHRSVPLTTQTTKLTTEPHHRAKNTRETSTNVCPSPCSDVGYTENGRNKRRYRLATITGVELVKRLETRVGGNVKVSEWPIQCTVASGQTGPRSLAVFIWHARHSRADEPAWNRKNRETEGTRSNERVGHGNVAEKKRGGNVAGTLKSVISAGARLSNRGLSWSLRVIDSSGQERDTIEGREVLVSAQIKATAAKFLR